VASVAKRSGPFIDYLRREPPPRLTEGAAREGEEEWRVEGVETLGVERTDGMLGRKLGAECEKLGARYVGCCEKLGARYVGCCEKLGVRYVGVARTVGALRYVGTLR
jgi:hypothetical protein